MSFRADEGSSQQGPPHFHRGLAPPPPEANVLPAQQTWLPASWTPPTRAWSRRFANSRWCRECWRGASGSLASRQRASQ
eukprot:gene12009-biopygen16904